MSNITNLNSLKSRLESALSPDGKLTLGLDALPEGDCLSFLKTLPGQQLQLLKSQFVPTGIPPTRLDLSATLGGSWSVPYLDKTGLSNVQLAFSFLQNRPTDPILSSLSLSADLSFAGNTVRVSGQLLLGSNLLDLSLVKLTGKPPVFSAMDAVNYLSGALLGSIVPPNIPILNSLNLSGVRLNFGFDGGAAMSLGIDADLDGTWEIISGGLFTLANPGASLLARYQKNPSGGSPRLSFSGNIHATTKIGSADFDVTLPLGQGDNRSLGVVPKSGQILPGLMDLAALVGGDSLKSTVQTGINNLGLGSISIDGININFDMPNKKLLNLELKSHITVGGGTISLYTRLPDFEFYGNLPAAGAPGTSPISVDTLAKQVLGDSVDLPHLDITALSLFANPGLGSYSFAIETEEDWTWDLSGSGKGPNLTLNKLGLNLEKTPQSVTGEMSVSASFGGFEVSFSARYQGKGNGWILTGTGTQENTVPLGSFIQDAAQKIGATVPTPLLQAVQGVEIKNLKVVINTLTKSFQFTADTTVTGQLPFGSKSYEVETKVFLNSQVDASTNKRTFDGNFEADLTVGQAIFLVSYDFDPNNKVFNGQWRSEDGTTVGFGDLADLLGISQSLSLPTELDLGLKAASFKYESANSNFTLSAESNNFGDAFFTAGKSQGGPMGFVFGVNFPPNLKLSALPGIGSDLKAADFLTFKQAAILISSADLKNYSIPNLPDLPPAPKVPGLPPSGGKTVKPIAAGVKLQLQTGFSVAGMLDFSSSSNDQKTKNLQSIVDSDELVLYAAVGKTGLKLQAELPGTVGIPTGGEAKLALTDPRVNIDLTTLPVFQLSGGMNITVDGTQIIATATLTIAETNAQVSINIASGNGSLPTPPGIKGLHFLQFGLQMGVFFEPPGLDLGVQGTFRIGDVQGTKNDQFAIVLEVLAAAPYINILYLSFYVDELSLGTAITLFTDKSDPGLSSSLDIVKGTDLGFHWSESIVPLPDGTIAQPGFGFSGTIKIFSFSAHAELEVGTTEGIHGKAEMSPINLKGIFQASGAGKGISRTYQQVNGQWQLMANNAIITSRPAPPTRVEVLIPPGGPIIEFNSLKSPFVRVNWQITLFDLVKVATDVTISTDGFSFLLVYEIGSIARFEMKCVMMDKEHFSASAQFNLGIDSNIGPIRVLGIDCGSLHLVAKIDAGVAITLDSSSFNMGIKGDFNFQGLKFSIPDLTISVAFGSLKELPEKIVQQIKDHADQLFSSLFSDAEKWAENIGNGIVVEVKDIAGSLKSAYHKTADEAVQLMKTAKQDAETVANGLKSAYGLTADAATTLMKGAGYAADQVADGLKQAYGLTAQGAAIILKGAGYAADEVGNALKSAFGQTADQVAKILKGASYTADQVGNALKSTFGETAQQAAQLLRNAGFAADVVAGVMKGIYGLTADQAAQVLKGAGFVVNEVGNALKSVWGASGNVAAQALKGAGFAVDQVGNFVKNAYNLGPAALNTVLQGVGYSADQVKNFFNALGGSFADTFKDIGRALDPTRW